MLMRIRFSALLAFVCIVAFVHGPSVSGQSPSPADPYVIIDLGTLGGNESVATALNENGNVAGWARRSDGAQHAFFFDATMHDLGTIGGASSIAWSVDPVGGVVGQSLTAISNTKGFIYRGGVRRSLGTLGGSNSAAYGINDFADVVGSANTTNNVATRAFLYRQGVMKSLGTLGGTNSVATAINIARTIVGSSTLAANSDVTHAFIYPDGGRMTDIGTLGTSSEASAVNTDDAVVGHSTLASGDTHAFLYSGGVMTDIGTLGGRNSAAKAIAGFTDTVVGESEIAGASGTHAFLYQNGVMVDLNTQLPAGSGWRLESANAVNFSGEIAGVGTIDGQRHAFLLTKPVRLRVTNNGIHDDTSNLPVGGVQVGRTVRLISSLLVDGDVAAHGAVLTDTITGPVTIEKVSTDHGSACAIAGHTVTCRLSAPGAMDEELDVIVRVTAPGVFSHTAHATAANAVPSPETDTATEENVGIALKSFTLSKTTVAGGTAVSARAELTSLPNPGGNVVPLESSNPAIAPVPSPFVVQRPTAFRTFNIVPPVVSEPTPVTISATFGLVTISQTLTVLPPALQTLSLTRSTMIGSCQTAIAKVTLTGDAPAAGARILFSTTTAGVHAPASVDIAPGATTASVSLSADAVHALTKGMVTAAYGGVSKAASLSVRPIFLTAVTLSPSTVTGGATSNGIATIECPAPAGGIQAALTSTNQSAAAPTAGQAVFAAGATNASFAVQTHPVSTSATPSIRVTVNGVTRSAPLTVKP
jgi:probable HAF family extracellular repeat protein